MKNNQTHQPFKMKSVRTSALLDSWKEGLRISGEESIEIPSLFSSERPLKNGAPDKALSKIISSIPAEALQELEG
jgi:hypothetical protein